MKEKNVAIIPARAGSKGIPNKNIKEFLGKPLIAWAIESALESKHIDRVILSSQDPKILAIAREYGAETPFIRPEEISRSTTATEPVLEHAFEWMVVNENYRADSIVLLMPTNPLRSAKLIDNCIEYYFSEEIDSLMTVSESPAHSTPYWTVVSNNNRASFFGGVDLKDGYHQRQAFPEKCFIRNDLVYVINPLNLLTNKPSIYGEENGIFEVDLIYCCDINTESDWEITEQRYKSLYQK